MNIGIDLDGTLTHNVVFYRTLMEGWMKTTGEVYILTGRSNVDTAITQGELKYWGLVKGIHYTNVCHYPEDYIYSRHIDGGLYMDKLGNVIPRDEIKLRIGIWKAQKCKERHISIVFDDDETFVFEMRRAGIYVLHADSKFEKVDERPQGQALRYNDEDASESAQTALQEPQTIQELAQDHILKESTVLALQYAKEIKTNVH